MIAPRAHALDYTDILPHEITVGDMMEARGCPADREIVMRGWTILRREVQRGAIPDRPITMTRARLAGLGLHSCLIPAA